MAIAFPSFSQAQDLYISGQNYAIDNGGKTVTLYFPTTIQASSGAIGPGNIGDNFLSNGSTSFFQSDNYLAVSGSIQQSGTSKQILMLCTVTSRNRENKYKIDDAVGIVFKKELTYIYGKFYMSEYHNVINSEYAIFNMPEANVDQMKFRRISHPRDRNSIARGRYASCWWEQIP